MALQQDGKYGRDFKKKYSHYGSDTKGHDIKAFGDTTGKYMFWDASADTLYITGALSVTGAVSSGDLALIDDETLTFGTGLDIVMDFDGTSFIIAATTDDLLIEVGDSATTQKSFDVKWYANEASGASYLYMDASANLIYTTGIDLQFKDSDILVFGTGAGQAGDIGITYDADSLNFLPVASSDALELGAAGHVLNTTIVGTLGVTGVVTVSADAGAYMTITQADGAGVTFASVSDGTASFTFSQSTDFTAGIKINTTDITLAPDATSGIGLYSQTGTLETNPGAAVIAHTINITHSAGAGDCDDLIAQYSKVNITTAGDADITAVGIAARAYVGTASDSETVADELYGIQPWVSHFGTGAITAMSGLSAKCDVNTGNFTATTVNAGHFHIEGASTVTGQFDGVMIEVYPDVTCMDSALAIKIDSGGVADAAIRLSGATATDFLKFAATGTCGATTSDPTVGAANSWFKCHIGDTICWLVGYADT